MKKRILALLTLTAMMALMIALSEAALAEADVCVSIQGDPKVDKGASTCFSEDTSKAVAVNSSDATALNDATAVAVNDSFALGVIDCTIVTTHPGEFDACVF
jgi:redox-regulated HSP33 family molecular chaperone